MTKISGGAGWNGDAYSSESFTGAGSLGVIATETNNARVVGLSSTASGADYAMID
ncbi:hypothetical protein [Thalassospira sp. HJ]|uniref:hypothetical protein n=1 Tax=Thalassospira sp. HJ TaxID=1616823 RepID=UPI000ABE8891|nr:hypothetical protein [Thalassospira sp. HJ]